MRFTIGKTTPQKEKLVRVAKECLEIGMKAAKPFRFVGDIGHTIEKHVKKMDFSSVIRTRSSIEFQKNRCRTFREKGIGMLLSREFFYH